MFESDRVNGNKDHLFSMMAYWDKNQVCRFANGNYLYWFGMRPEDMVNKITMKDLLGALYEENLPSILQALDGFPQVLIRNITTPAGDVRKAIATYYPDIIDGEVAGFFAHVTDMNDIVNLEVEKTLFETKYNAYLNLKPVVIIDEIFNRKGKVDQNMLNVAETLKQNLLNKFPGLDQLASLHCMSVSKLKRDFKIAFNVTPYMYYRKLQMIYAEQYLTHIKCSKKEVASMLDFSNPSNFYSAFKKFQKDRVA